MYFDMVHTQLTQKREGVGYSIKSSLDVFFADDATVLETAPTIGELSELANFNDKAVHETMQDGRHTIQVDKTQNMFMDPRVLMESSDELM